MKFKLYATNVNNDNGLKSNRLLFRISINLPLEIDSYSFFSHFEYEMFAQFVWYSPVEAIFSTTEQNVSYKQFISNFEYDERI